MTEYNGPMGRVSETNREQSPVESEVRILCESISSMLESVHTLRNRCEPLVYSGVEESNNNVKEASSGTPQRALAPLPDMIRDQRYRVESANALLQNLLIRLEI